jgi:hypothetical protein
MGNSQPNKGDDIKDGKINDQINSKLIEGKL